MPRLPIIAGLDIGTSTIKILVAAPKEKSENFEVLSSHQEPSLGVRRGVVVNPHNVAGAIASLVKKAEQDCGRKISGVYASIGGCHIFCNASRGLVSVSRADQKISEEDIDRVLQNAQSLPLPPNKEILDIFPKEYIVDEEKGVKEAVGMQGMRLEADVLVLCGFSPYLKNSIQAISNAGLQINFDLIPTPLASARAVLSPREKELGVVVLDIGAGTTSLAVFEEASLIHAAVFPIGSASITSDIAICLKTDIDVAEKIKIEFGSCHPNQRFSKDEKKIKIEGEEPLIFSKKTLSEIIEARVSEIFSLASKELKKISKQGLLPSGVVLTGGGAKLPGIKDLAKKELGLPCRVGVPKRFSASLEDPSFSVLCGLVMEGVALEVEPSGNGMKSRIKGFFRNFIP